MLIRSLPRQYGRKLLMLLTINQRYGGRTIITKTCRCIPPKPLITPFSHACIRGVGTEAFEPTASTQSVEESEIEDIQMPETFYRKFGDDVDRASEILKSLDAEDTKRLNVLKLEYDLLYSDGSKVPDVMSDGMWLKMLRTPTVHARRKEYNYWFKTEKSALSERRRKLKRQREREVYMQSVGGDDRPPRNTLFLKLHSQTMNRWQLPKFVHALQDGPRLVFDLSFSEAMALREKKSLAEQLMFSYGHNRMSPEPFHIYLCGASSDNSVLPLLRKYEKETKMEEYLWDMVEEDVVDTFDREDIIYLSPNAETEMLEYDPEKVYVIGGLVDTGVSSPLSLAKGKREKLKTVKLPLDRYVKFKQGTKSLTIDQMLKIMMSFKDTANWTESLVKHIPKRKLDLEFMSGNKPIVKRRQYKRSSKFQDNNLKIDFERILSNNSESAWWQKDVAKKNRSR